MSFLQWLLGQLQRGYTYLIGLTDQVVSNVIAAGIVALLGVVWAWLMVRVFRRKRKEKEGESFDEAFLRRQRKAMLGVVERQWIEGRLERSLHHQAPILLGLTEAPEAVERPWEYEIQTPDQARRRTRDTGDILDVFDACGSLLILGMPGSGKTVTLLDLARQLIARARNDEDAPLPIVFVLASWVQEKKPLDEWMVAEMERQYRVPPVLGRHWIERYEVLPFLDGLDEVHESARVACVEAINAYRSVGVGGAAVVVCSRETEYAQLSARLKVDGAVMLQPLEDQQVRQYLRRFGKKTAMLARMLAEDDQLRELVRTPLWLDVMAVAYEGDGNATAPKTVTTGDILDAYIRRVLFQHRQPLQEWSLEQSLRWLRWLAQQLERTEQTLFRLEEMQPDWLGGEAEQKRYQWWLRWGPAAIGALILGFLLGMIDGPALGLAMGLAFLLTIGLTNGIGLGLPDDAKDSFIIPVAKIVWDWREAREGLRFGPVMGGLSSMLVFGLLSILTPGQSFELVGALAVGLGLGALLGLVIGLMQGLQSIREITREVLPNLGIWRSAREGLVHGAGYGLIPGLALGLYFGYANGLVSGIAAGFLAGLMVWLLAAVRSPGGDATLRHCLLRWWLWRGALTPRPWQYVAYLDEMAGRLLLDRIGGAYRFKHELLQKHIAQLDNGSISLLPPKP